MKYKMDKARLDALMAQRGIASYQALSELAAEQGMRLAFSTIYLVVNESSDTGWRSTTLAALCRTLQCSAVDLIPELAISFTANEGHRTTVAL